MGNYKISVNVEITESDEKIDKAPRGNGLGNMKFTISESEAISIDKCEKALLATNYPAIREAISKHLTDVSKKKTQKKQEQEQGVKRFLKTNSHEYLVDGEIGRITFKTHSVLECGKIVYNTNQDLFHSLVGNEWYKTCGFKEISMVYGDKDLSYRKTSALINRIRYQEGATPLRTLHDNTELEGSKVINLVEKKTEKILEENSFTKEGNPLIKSVKYGKEGEGRIPKEKVEDSTKICMKSISVESTVINDAVCYESPDSTVNISIDDVGVKKQKETRDIEEQNADDRKNRKRVENTIVHIQKGDKKYILNGSGTCTVLRFLIAFLLNNNLINSRLQFFVDGQRTLQAAILKAFSWHRNIGIILDWYHLNEKCKMQLSLAMKGTDNRNDVLKEVSRLLWYGLIDEAQNYLNSINQSMLKNIKAIETLKGYFERNRLNIPCYAVRKELGLRNSSNTGEKMNDLVVSDRQKHNGMSWSKSGSVALASITALVRNKEHTNWFENNDINFELAA